MTGTARRLDGLGALLFLASFAGIAYFVQSQTVPDDREQPKTPITAVGEPVRADAPPPVLPWEDRLSMRDMELEAILGSVPSPDAKNGKASAPDQAFVQTLNDGHRILWTLDPVLHNSALTIFKNREVPYGAAVVLDLRDNSVLAFAGHSSADPDVDPLEILTTAWAPAASTFKLITTASLLEHEDANPTTRVCFFGGLRGISDEALKDDSRRDTRCETLSSAIAHSYNLVIAKLALRNLDQKELVSTAHRMQFEATIPFEFPVERSPIDIPGDGNERARVAAGFWHVDQSPLHGALVASIFARTGNFQPPHLVREVLSPADDRIVPPQAEVQRVLAEDVASAVGKMMARTTIEGTARKSFRDNKGARFLPNTGVAGKTGSLTGKRAPAYNYNWFLGYAPADDPEMAFAVLLANEPSWRIKAHYAGRRIVQVYLSRRDAIRRARDARLSREGVVLPARDNATGALLADGEQSTSPTTPTPGVTTTVAPLPPVPGARPPAQATDKPTPPTLPSAG